MGDANVSAMGTGTANGSEIRWLLPHEIRTDERYNVRLADIESAAENERLEELAASLDQEGQIETLVVSPVKGEADGQGGHREEFLLISGHRRKLAATIVNEKRSAKGESLLKLRCVIDRDKAEDSLFRKAVASNLHRKDFSPMDLAALIVKIREKKGWTGFKGAKQVAQYLNIKPATVLKHEGFLLAPKKIQDALRDGSLSVAGADEMLTVSKDHQEPVLKRAKELQTDRNIEQAIVDVERGHKTEDQAVKALSDKNRIEQGQIRRAIREKEQEVEQAAEKAKERVKAGGPESQAALAGKAGAGQQQKQPSVPAPEPVTSQSLPRTKKEILVWFLEQDGPANGGADGSVRKWLRAFGNWAAGEISDRSFQGAWDRMVAGADKGTIRAVGEKPEAEQDLKAKTSHSGRLTRKDAGKSRKPKTDKIDKKAAKPKRAAKDTKK